jgi:hypothetical protein
MGVAALPRRRRRSGSPVGALGWETRRPADRPSHSSGFEWAPCAEKSGAAAMLDDLIAAAWDGLSVLESVRCPACGGEMASQDETMVSSTALAARAVLASSAGGPSETLWGECVDCGTRLC